MINKEKYIIYSDDNKKSSFSKETTKKINSTLEFGRKLLSNINRRRK
jgi:hypothetical protein